jgi:hypothetical protein
MAPRAGWAGVNCSDSEKRPTVAYGHDVDQGIIFAIDVESRDEEWASGGVFPLPFVQARGREKKASASRQAKLTEDVLFRSKPICNCIACIRDGSE